eukprot:247338_1
MALSHQTVDIIDSVVLLITTVAHILILYYLLHSFNKPNTKVKSSGTKIKIIVVSYFVFVIIYSVSEVINSMSRYMIDTEATDDKHDHLYNVLFYITYIICGFADAFFNIAFIFFLNIRLQNTYQKSFLKVNRKFMTCCLIIFCISEIIFKISEASFYGLSYWYAVLQSNKYQVYNNVATLQYFIINLIYLFIILYIFNQRAYKFMCKSMEYNPRLTININLKLENEITKQTNLISLIAILTIFYWVIYGIYWNYTEMSDAHTHIGYIFIKFFYFLSRAIYLYLTFKENEDKYNLWCKHTHRCCISCCEKLFFRLNKNAKNTKTVRLLTRDFAGIGIFNDQSLINDEKPVVYDDDEKELCDDVSNCCVVNKICQLLHKYQKGKLCEDDIITTDILDDFNHLLTHHDSNDDFNQIYNKLNDHCHYKNCKYYKRHYRRRVGGTRQKQGTKEANKVTSILDKIHAFYQHSYDTSLRRKPDEKTNEDDNIYVNPRSNSLDNIYVNNSKFNSNLSLNDSNDNNIYSFGQRFEYEDTMDGNNKWLVGAKYKDFKHELIHNAIYAITIEVYKDEYDKCSKHMKTNHVKRIQHKNIEEMKLIASHILALLIYCNCDIYQNEWSATFRRQSLTETDESFKKRHSHFYYSSLYLRYLVEHFGMKLIDVTDKKFYHGVSEVLCFGRTTTQFNCPLSTSQAMNVALLFTKEKGIILTLQYSFSTYVLYARFFECEYFSDYPNEKECLFVGGLPLMIIKNIYNVTTGEQYEKYINSLNIINCLLNGTYGKNNNNYIVNN